MRRTRRDRARSPEAGEGWSGTFVLDARKEPLKILGVRARDGTDGVPGTVAAVGTTVALHTGRGWLEVLELQPPGKRAMSAADYLRGAGRGLQPGSAFPG